MLEEERQRLRAYRVWGVVSLGVSGAALTVGTLAGLGAIQQSDVVDGECQPDCSPEGIRAARHGRTLATISEVNFAAGILLAGLGAGLLVFGSSAPETPARLRVGIWHNGLWVGTHL